MFKMRISNALLTEIQGNALYFFTCQLIQNDLHSIDMIQSKN